MNRERQDAYSFERAEQTFIQRVYQWMAAGLALSGIVAFWTAQNPAMIRALSGGMFIVLILVELGLVFWLSSQALKLSPGTAVTGFLVY
ncbi:MAG TPA: Bax inhibitor-1 family protein, partial [bacterium]|nr:Bax inhibitor-1 family protein [bacterium]